MKGKKEKVPAELIKKIFETNQNKANNTWKTKPHQATPVTAAYWALDIVNKIQVSAVGNKNIVKRIVGNRNIRTQWTIPSKWYKKKTLIHLKRKLKI